MQVARRNSGIDLLRGLSIVLVIMHHLGLRIPLKESFLAYFLPKWFLSALIYNGSEAVFMFFVISGFLIASNTIERWGSLSAIEPRAFYSRRATRILPCLLILIAVLSCLHLLHVENYTIDKQSQSLPSAIFAALGLYLNWYEGLTGSLPGNWDVLWSLSIEEAFYLSFPLACLFARKRWQLVTFLTLLALSLPVTRGALAENEIWQEKAYLPGMAAIATGILAAILAKEFKPIERHATCLQVAGSIGIIAILFFESLFWRQIGNGALLILTLSSASLLIGCQWRYVFNPNWSIPGTTWIRSCGRLSYEMYLTHMFIVWPVVSHFKQSGSDVKWGILWYGPALALSWLLGTLVARFISLPAEQVIHRRFQLTNSVPSKGFAPHKVP